MLDVTVEMVPLAFEARPMEVIVDLWLYLSLNRNPCGQRFAQSAPQNLPFPWALSMRTLNICMGALKCS